MQNVSPTKKTSPHFRELVSVGGEDGIRTHERVTPVTAFPMLRLRPLGHLSAAMGVSSDTPVLHIQLLIFLIRLSLLSRRGFSLHIRLSPRRPERARDKD